MTALDYDLSLPLATLLRQGTAAAHESAEHSQGAGWLLRGELDQEEYARFLMMLWHVYSELESALEKYSADPTLAPTYHPNLLVRAPRIGSDIAYLLGVPEADWQSHPIHQELITSPPEPFSAYVNRIRELATPPSPGAPAAAGPGRLLAQAYVRYLGDLSGGQAIRRRIAKAYDLKEGAGGVEFYRFGSMDGAEADAGPEERKRIREWYRDGMNEGAGDDRELKLALVQEAIVAFELNTNIFSVLRPPTHITAPMKSVPETMPLAAAPPLGDPTSPVPPELAAHALRVADSSSDGTASSGPSRPPSPNHLDGALPLTKEAPALTSAETKTYKVASVVAIVGAVCLAHFLLVVGGVTGSNGVISRMLAQL